MTGYAIQGGADQDKLSITSSGGVLTSRTAPDFEMPGDVASTARPTRRATTSMWWCGRRAARRARSADYTATSGTLTFAPGETSKTIARDDSIKVVTLLAFMSVAGNLRFDGLSKIRFADVVLSVDRESALQSVIPKMSGIRHSGLLVDPDR